MLLEMSKLPSIQFYPADWRKDPGVQSLSFHDKGVWLEILCLMHESEQRGKLLLNGNPMPDDALARLLGLDKQNLAKTLRTLLDFGVASRCPESGALINRRMVRDEALRKIRQEAGKLGGNPALLKQNPNQNPTTGDKQRATPSSSPSTSEEDKRKKQTKAKPPPDPRSQHPAIQAYRQASNRYPEKDLYDDIIRTLGDTPDSSKLTECRKEWVKRGYNVLAATWALDWYRDGIPERNGNSRPNGVHNGNHKSNAGTSGNRPANTGESEFRAKRQI